MNQAINTALVSGRIEDIESYNGSVYTAVRVPNSDPYGNTKVLRIRSEATLGKVGDEIEAHCELGGSSSRAQTKDGKDFRSYRMSLDYLGSN